MTVVTPEHDHLRGAPLERGYWLTHCAGFRVDAAEGRLGFVEDVLGDDPAEALLAVRAGVLGRRVLLVPVEEIEAIVPRSQRIWLRPGARIVGPEPLAGAA